MESAVAKDFGAPSCLLSDCLPDKIAYQGKSGHNKYALPAAAVPGQMEGRSSFSGVRFFGRRLSFARRTAPKIVVAMAYMKV